MLFPIDGNSILWIEIDDASSISKSNIGPCAYRADHTGWGKSPHRLDEFLL